MIALVTGATGFVGGRLATRLLEKGHRVVALCRDGDPPKGCEVVRGQLEDLAACERAVNEHQPHQVFHLAAQAIVPSARRDPLGTLESNIRGSYNLLEAFRRHRREDSVMVVASSDKAYGELKQFADWEASYREGDALEGRGPYDVSKSCTDLIAQMYGHEYGIPIGIVRAGNIYGPGDDDPTRIVPSTVESLRHFEPVTISSDGTPIRDYLWIDDAVDGYFAVARYLTVGAGVVRYSPRWPFAVNMSGGEPVSVSRLVEIATEVFLDIKAFDHYPAPRVLGTRMGEISKQVLNNERAKRELGWTPKVPLREGLRRTIHGIYDG